ncbi:MAG: ABC transporter permease [Candidatus Nanoarchaeia archaeon]
MDIKEYFRIALRSLFRRKTRSWLTAIGIFIGIAAVVALVSLGQGVQAMVYDQFEAMGTNKIFVSPASGFATSGDNIGYAPLTTEDARFLESLSGINEVTYYVMASARIEYQDVVRYFSVIGTPTQTSKLSLMKEMYGDFGIQEGREIEQGDKKATEIGFHHASRGLYDGKDMSVGSKYYINNEAFYVAGLMEPIGSTQDDRMILLPEDSFREVTSIEDRVDFIIIEMASEANVNSVADSVKRKLARHRDVKIDDLDFTLQTPQDLLDQVGNVLNIVTSVLIGIAAISLFVGLVGIMNTMYTSVLERKKEIGIMKAIGASDENIFGIFLVESGVLGFVGGIIGILIGMGLALLVQVISAQILGATFLKAHFSIGLLVGSLFFSFIVGAIAGTLPARQASKEKPSQNLRDE